jgi:hypothetical protein
MPELSDAVKIGGLGGSIISGIAGWLVFGFCPRGRYSKLQSETVPEWSCISGRIASFSSALSIKYPYTLIL